MRRSMKLTLSALFLLALSIVKTEAAPNGATVCTGISTNYQTITCPDINEEFTNVNNRGIINLGSITNVGNAYSGNAIPYALTSYVDGQHFSWKPSAPNTGPATVNWNGLGAKALVKQNGTALSSGDLQSTTLYGIRYY